jgi:hypothetical protein
MVREFPRGYNREKEDPVISMKRILRKFSVPALLAIIAIAGCGGSGAVMDPIAYNPEAYLPGHWMPGIQAGREQVEQEEWVRAADDIGLHTIVHRPADSSPENRYPGLILIPGSLQTAQAWHAKWNKSNAWEFVDAGLIVLIYDSRGRGLSGGQEDFNGHLNQDDLKTIIEWLSSRDDVLPGGIGIATSSWGITVASGTLARYPDLPIRFLLDREGADNRYVITQWDDPEWVASMGGHGTWDDEFWSEREAIRYIGDITCPYFRLQSNFDHALNRFYVAHAIHMVNAAVEGASPYVRLNGMPPNVTYDTERAREYEWYDIKDADVMFYLSVLESMSLTTELE